MRPPASLAPRWGLWASLGFWIGVAVETLTRRGFSRVLARRLRGRAVRATGVEVIPREGAFVLAVNHGEAGLSLDVIAAVVEAAAAVRPGLGDDCVVVLGHRAPRRPPSRLRRLVRGAATAFLDRWAANAIRIPMEEGAPGGMGALRAWRQRAARQPVLVFPEGVAQRELGSMRAGAGRWLGGLPVPTVPVGVWWDGAFCVAFGAAVAWSPRPELRDLQLGLAIAALLPAGSAPAWQGLLGRWRAAHAG